MADFKLNHKNFAASGINRTTKDNEVKSTLFALLIQHSFYHHFEFNFVNLFLFNLQKAVLSFFYIESSRKHSQCAQRGGKYTKNYKPIAKN